MTGFIRILAVGFVGAVAAGCSNPMTNGPEHLYNVEQQFPIVVEPQVATLLVQIDDGLQTLARGEHERVRAFAERWKARGQGVLNAAMPTGSPNQAAAGAALGEIKNVLASSGIERSALQVTSYRAAQGDNDAPITLTFVTYAAGTADCGSDWSRNLGFTPRNLPWPEFGCSTQHNIAAVVADPRDFIEPRATAPADAMRRSIVLEKFQKGEPTRTADESKKDSGVVSTVSK